MKLKTHEKLLRFRLLLSKKRVDVMYIHRDDDVIPLNYAGAFDSEDACIYVRYDFVDPFILAHEFFHAYQYKKSHKRKYIKAYDNMQPLPEDLREDVWGYRRYKYQLLEREANRFALRHCFFTGEFKVFKEHFKDEMKEFFLYYLGFKAFIDLFR